MNYSIAYIFEDLESVSIVIGETRMKAMCSFSETHITIISRRMQRMSINLKTDVESVLYCQPQDQVSRFK